jgi:hypothetical protein
MNEFKYTTDGKKVVVIGNLNAQEKIVQEVFIVNNQEVPSGENFVVRSLHDFPAVSWQEKRIKEVEERYKKEYNQRLDEMSRLEKRHREITKEFRNKIEYIKSAIDKIKPETFDLMADYICGDIKYILVTGYDLKIMDMAEFNESYEERLRLISFFGKDDGSFTYAIGDYYDYSGGHKKFIPFHTKEEAIAKLESILSEKDKISADDKKLAEKYGIKLDAEKLNDLKHRSIDSLTKNIKSYQESIEKWENSIKEISESK